MNLQSPKGLMLHGDVGTGKSMLIDLFQDSLPTRKKRRWHFNTFMLDTFSRLEVLRKSRIVTTRAEGLATADEYSLLWLARDLIQTSPILFLDEFQLPDRAASKILSNLMTSFFQLGGVLIATSNRMPEELAKAAGMEFARPVSRLSRLGWRLGMGGVVGRDDGPGQRGEFAQFLEVLRARCEVWEMEEKKDYRRLAGEEDVSVLSSSDKKSPSTLFEADISADPGAGGPSTSYPSSSTSEVKGSDIPSTQDLTSGNLPGPSFTNALPKHYLITPPTNASSSEISAHTSALETLLIKATSSPHPIPWTPTTLTVYGRPLLIPAQYAGTALFTFAQLCGAILGPADCITLASTYHTIILTGVPVLGFLQKNEARRLITLLDAFYEARCCLLITAAAGPDDLFFPTTPISSASAASGEEQLLTDAVHPETYSEIHQDLTSPFRPNISSYSPSSSSPSTSLPMDALEDDPPNRVRRLNSSFTDERKLATEGAKAPDFSNVGGLTGEDERFAVRRAESRMWEMCSARWWDRASSSDGLEDGEEGKGWWRPLPLELRHWERSPDLASSTTTDAKVQVPACEVVQSGSSDSSARQEQGMFAHGASPFRTSSDAPPKIWSTHVWGMVKWGKRAGAWGKGVEGLEERRKAQEAMGPGNDEIKTRRSDGETEK